MKDIYVSPDGDGDGAPDSPCSLEKARSLVRERNQDMTSDINVYIDDGVYELRSPFILSPRDSGSNGFKILWRNKPGTKPVFSGAQVITGWSLHDAESNIWKAPVSEGRHFEHLWVNGRRAHRAWSGWNPSAFANTRRGVRVKASGPDVSKWRNPEDIVVTKKFMWRYIPCKVERIHDDELLLDPQCVRTYRVPRGALGVLEPIGLYGLVNGIAIFTADIAIENAYELLTDEGEWYLDRSDSTLYYKPLESDEFNSGSEALYSVLETFILLDGTEQNPVENIAIEGLTFEYSRGTKMGITAGSPTEPTRAIPPKPQNAIQVNAGQSITIKSNTFLHIAADALHFDLMGKDIKIVGNAFGDISRAAISLNQTNLAVSNANKRGVLPENAHRFFDGVEISNNYVRLTGIDDIGAAIVFSEFTRNLKLTHNEIREVPTCAVRNGWRFLAYKHHTTDIEYAWNKTSGVGQAGMEDYSALYLSCSNTGGSSIHHNLIDGVGLKNGNFAIYLDVNANHTRIYSNICKGMPQKPGGLLPGFGGWIGRIASRLPGFGGWIGLVISRHNEIYNNWSDSRLKTDISSPHYRFWPSRTNKFHDNHFHSLSDDDLPEEAREVMARAGLIPEYQDIKEPIDSELGRGYISLDKLYT